MQPQPLIAVRDVPASSRWYQQLLGCASGHGGHEYEQLVDSAGTLIGRQLVARGLVQSGAAVVLVSIHPDLARNDANYLKIKRL